jgi:O-antigen/teichoic acid export membrane protein
MLGISQQLNRTLKKISNYLKADLVYIAQGSFWIAISQVVLSSTSFVLSIIYANFILPETLGVYKYVLSLAGFFSIATLSGMGTSITQSIARGNEGSFIPALKTRLRWGLLGGLASIIASLYYYLHSNYILGASFLIVAAFVPFMDSFNIFDAILNARKEFKKSSLYYTVSQITSTFCIIVVAVYTQNVYFMLLTYFGTWTALRIIFTIHVITKRKLNTITDPQAIRNGIHLSFINVINTIASLIDKVLVFQVVGASALAIYSIATAPIDQVKNFMTRSLSALAMPKYSIKEKGDLKQHVFRWTFRIGLILIPITLLYVLLSPFLFSILFPKYHQFVWYSQIYALTLLPSLFFLPQTALNAHMAKKELYYFSLTASVAQIGLLIGFAYTMGLVGVIIARIIARFINLVVSLYLLKKM